MTAPAVSAASLSVHFGGIAALTGVDLEVQAGEVLGLVGANGAGKSTMVKVLAGAIPHGSYLGTISRSGGVVSFGGPHDAEAHGVGLVHQELVGVPELTVMENVLLERYPRGRLNTIDWGRTRRQAEDALGAIGAMVSLDSRFMDISPANQQLVQLARVIHAASEVVLFDEPTSSLSPPEVARLFDAIRGMRREGRAVILITHRIAEVFEVCDRIQVLQNGRSAGEFDPTTASHDDVVRAMLGEEPTDLYPHTTVRKPGPVVFEASNVAGAASSTSVGVQGVSFELREGEILGLFGLLGAGRTELLDLLFGIQPCLAGASIRLGGVEIQKRSPYARLNAGLGLVTEDRKRTGLVLGMSVQQNLVMASLDRVSRSGVVQSKRERDLAMRYIDSLGIVTAGPEALVLTLSGGNQQKVVLGKWLSREPRVLLLDEPTRGIDVGAKGEVFRILAGLAARGMAVLFVSSEVAEVASFCDRALVMYRGQIVRELRRDELNEAALMRAATGVVAA